MVKRATSNTTVATVEQVLITDVLVDRPGVVPGKSAGEAFVALAGVMANAPDDLAQALCDMALDLCDGGTAGICIIRTDAKGQDYFYWEAVAGQLAGKAGGTTSRDFSPCGTSIDRGATQ